jgi:hypothetical protein
MVGIDVQAYRRWIAKADPVLDEFRNAIMGIRRMELMRVMAARESVLAKVIGDGLNKFTDPATRLEIHKYLAALNDELLDSVHVTDSDKANFLTGPKLVEATSTVVEHDIEVNLKIKGPDIIDSQFSDDTP